jgi:hypothetical protein
MASMSDVPFATWNMMSFCSRHISQAKTPFLPLKKLNIGPL